MCNVRLYEKRKKKMRRKLLIVSMLVFAMMGLTSCGSKSADADESVQTVETVQSVDEEESSSDEIEQQSETAADEVSTELETEEAEESGQDGSEVMWYMDSEGMKSDELGIVMRKNPDDEEQVFGLSGFFARKTYDTVSVECNYYNGNIDTYAYISGTNDMQKTSIGGVEYAYTYYDNYYSNNDSVYVVFAGNGIAVSAVIPLAENETVEEAMNCIWNDEQRIGLCDEFEMDCMAYMTDDGIYCPVLGMKFLADSTNKRAICRRESAQDEVHESIKFEYCYKGIPSLVFNENVQDAKDAVEKCVKFAMKGSEDSTSAGETETRNFGKYTYYGKGYTWINEYSFGDGTKYFCSDDTEWTIEFSYDNGGENYIDCIESLE